ncbi:hypothetical protein CDAR_54161 [Caerostris darwini]|uniref:Uncharacterized protein n=1 Tax=Caerostris darwini TaxID=1538125 RepID=A0AAV4TC50_9ARAC|nr:hypothetical protein CDAR_54161 [Caerostris darwini]
MLCLVVLLFALCWLPFQLYNIFQEIVPAINRKIILSTDLMGSSKGRRHEFSRLDIVCLVPNGVDDLVCLVPNEGDDLVCLVPNEGDDLVCLVPNDGTQR